MSDSNSARLAVSQGQTLSRSLILLTPPTNPATCTTSHERRETERVDSQILLEKQLPTIFSAVILPADMVTNERGTTWDKKILKTKTKNGGIFRFFGY